jgi:hypothetical protein
MDTILHAIDLESSAFLAGADCVCISFKLNIFERHTASTVLYIIFPDILYYRFRKCQSFLFNRDGCQIYVALSDTWLQ